jgi:F0F1-type ATP synthase assembly protein I
MVQSSFDSKEFSRYATYSQIGLEMVGPIILGLIVDHYAGTRPWGVVIGAFLGFFGGIFHLVQLLNKQNRPPSSGPGGP